MPGSEIYPHQSKVNQSMRSQVKKHLPVVLWLTGLSGSGKVPLPISWRMNCNVIQVHTYLQDWDNIRTGLNSVPVILWWGSPENIKAIGKYQIDVRCRLIVITALSAISHKTDCWSPTLPQVFWKYLFLPNWDLTTARSKGLYKISA
jgi:adenylylsulfate kinase-like enzyme